MNCRQIALLAVVAGMPMAVAAEGAIVGTDGFSYPNGSIVGQSGGSGWAFDPGTGTQNGTTSAWQGEIFDPAVTPAQVSDGTLVTQFNTARRDFQTDTGAGAFKNAGVIYFAAEMTRAEGADWGGISAMDFGAERAKFFVNYDSTDERYEFVIENTNAGTVSSNVPVIVGETYTLVGEVDLDEDKVRFWLNPTAESDAAIVTADYTSDNWHTGVRLASGGTGPTTWDNLAIATTFNEAISAVPEPATALILACPLAAGRVMRRRR